MSYKVTIALPDDLRNWVKSQADDRFLSPVGFLRHLIIERFRADKGGEGDEPVAVQGAQRPQATRSGFKGVYAYAKRWAAVVRSGGKPQRLGVYDTPEEAARIYDAAMVARAGGDPRAAVNFPPDDRVSSTDAAFYERLQRGEQLSAAEWAAVSRGEPLPSAPPVAPVPDESAPLVDANPRSLRRGGPPIPRPAPEDVVPLLQKPEDE